jgi:hypothetical protein
MERCNCFFHQRRHDCIAGRVGVNAIVCKVGIVLEDLERPTVVSEIHKYPPMVIGAAIDYSDSR